MLFHRVQHTFCRYFTIGNPSDLKIGQAAIKKLNELNHGKQVKSHLRVQIDAGGCHGAIRNAANVFARATHQYHSRYQYKMMLTDKLEKDDIVFDPEASAAAKFITDPITLDMIKGGKLDWVEELIESSFQIVENPNAESSCGCKVSFNIKI